MRYLFLLCALAAAIGCGMQLGPLVALRLLRISSVASRVDGDALLQDRGMAFACLAAASALLATAFGYWLLPPCLITSVVLARRMPAMLAARAQRRKAQACDASLDVLADIVAMGVGAGLSFDAAVDMYCAKFEGPLSDEMAMARAVAQSGIASRSEALMSRAESIGSKEFRRFAETSIQATERGAPLAKMLASFAVDVRRQRRSALEQRIAKAPVKMLVPTGLLILPAMLILVMGPALLQFLGTGA